MIGIIIPAYNVAQYLGATLDSILLQTASDWQCIIVDDGSTDKTAAVAEGYVAGDARFLFLQQKNAGPCVARNLAFGKLDTSIKYVSFMDADDIYESDALERLRTEVESHPNAVGSHGLADMIDAEGRPLNAGTFADMGRRRLGYDGNAIVAWPLDKPTTFEVLLYASKVYPPGLIMARREIYEKVGPWDPRIPIAADWDMILRLSRHGELRFLNRVILKYRRHPANISNQLRKNYAEIRYLYHKTFFSPENSDAQRRSLKGGWRAWQLYKIREKLGQSREHIRAGRALRGTQLLAHLPAHVYRYARGYPTASRL
ncbi:MAG TPA: glycosyltransferase [Humisphaera sp.]|nr:glycosyltransferase [Humisphaera sp.]